MDSKQSYDGIIQVPAMGLKSLKVLDFDNMGKRKEMLMGEN
jgi:hypothetical protein